MRFTLLTTAFLSLGLCACSAPKPRVNPGPSVGEGDLERSELLRRARQSEVVLIGSVERRFDELEGTRYRVRVIDLLSASQTAGTQTEHPYSDDAQIEISDQLFVNSGRELAIGGLEPFVNYVFVLVPSHAPNRWLNLIDPSKYPLPGARELGEDLRDVHDPAPPKGADDDDE